MFRCIYLNILWHSVFRLASHYLVIFSAWQLWYKMITSEKWYEKGHSNNACYQISSYKVIYTSAHHSIGKSCEKIGNSRGETIWFCRMRMWKIYKSLLTCGCASENTICQMFCKQMSLSLSPSYSYLCLSVSLSRDTEML